MLDAKLARLGLAAAAVGLLATEPSPEAQGAAPKPEQVTVTIENMQFNPASVTVHRGARIRWVNKDLFPHTATADGGVFDSREIGANATWAYVAGKPGQYSYSCKLHPTMKARLIVR